jgi:hypothetical protein
VLVVVGVTLKTREVELAGVEIGDTGVDVVPFGAMLLPDTVVGEEGPVVITLDDVGELGGEVELPDVVATIVPDVVGDVGTTTAVAEVDVAGDVAGDVGGDVAGDVGVRTGLEVVGALEGDDNTEPMTLVSEAMMLERRLPRPVLLVVAAGDGVGVGSGVITPVEADPVTPVEVGERMIERIDEMGSGTTDVVAATGEDALGAAVGVGVGVGVGVVGVGTVGVGVVGSRTPERRPLRLGNRPSTLDVEAEVDVDAAAVAVDPPLPENVTPDVRAELELGLEELVVVPPVKIPPGPKVIPLAAAEDDDDGVLTVVGEALSGVTAGLEEVGWTITAGTLPLEAAAVPAAVPAEVSGSKRPGVRACSVELDELAAVGLLNPTIVVWVITTVIT